MKRREFIAALGSAAAWPLVSQAQEQQAGLVKKRCSYPGRSPYVGTDDLRKVHVSTAGYTEAVQSA